MVVAVDVVGWERRRRRGRMVRSILVEFEGGFPVGGGE